MLSPADAALVARDPDLPGMALLLEPEELLARVDGFTVDVRSVRTTYLRYKPGTSLIAGLRLVTTSGPVFGFATAYARGCEPKIAKDKAYADAAASGLVGLVGATGVLLGTAEGDRQLPGIARLLHAPEHRPGVLGAARLHPLRYKPARRWVARAGGAQDPVAVVKVHRPGTLAGSVRAHRWLHAAGAPVAELLDVDDERGSTVVRWVPGRTLERDDLDPDAARAAGHALAQLHDVSPDARLPAAAPIAEGLQTALNAIAVLAPAWLDEAAEVAARVTSMIPMDRPQALTHGDFSADQVVVHAGTATIVDLDRAQLGDPVAELAGYAAAGLAGSRSGRPARSLESVSTALLTGYREGGGAGLDGALAPLTAAALLALADEPFRLRRENWPDRMAELIATAGRVLDRA
ncbi:hypothetical protein BH20ACT5_BH20ACT5_25690 [soil metagenome]